MQEFSSSCNPPEGGSVRGGVDGGLELQGDAEWSGDVESSVGAVSSAGREASATLGERLTGEIPRLRSFLGRVSRGPVGEVDDLVQESLARALRFQASYDGGRALWPWLKRVAFRVFLDAQAAPARRREVAEVDVPAEPSAPRLDARDEVARLLASLPATEREVLVRFHQRSESVHEIALALRLPEGTVKSHLHRARRRLAAERRTEEPG